MRKHDIIAGMTGTEYEAWCAEQLRQLGYRKIRLTKTTGDQGIDILAKKDGISWCFQCKYYSQPVGNFAVQEAYAGMSYYGCEKAAVLTNASFTPAALELAGQTGIELWDHFSPPETYSFFFLIRILAVIVILLSGYLTYESCIESSDAGSAFGGIGVIAGMLAGIANGGYGRTCASVIFLVITAASALSLKSLPWRILQMIALLCAILEMIRWTAQKKQRIFTSLKQERTELKERIAEGLNAYGKRAAELLSEDLQTEITLQKCRRKKDGSCEFTFRASSSVAQLLKEESLKLNENGRQFELSADTERVFRLCVQGTETERKNR